jgi:hypothetical protein
MRYFILIIFIILTQLTNSQTKCECCGYQSLDYADNMDDFFHPETVVRENYKVAIIYTVERIGPKETRYPQAKIYFDKNGKIVTKKLFYKGKASLIIEYERNIYRQIIIKTESYMDSLENKSDFMSPKIEDFEYDNNKNLIKTKKRSDNGKVVPDNLSEYTKYEYDKLNRMIREYRYTYYDAKSIYIFDQKFDYISSTDSKSVTLNNGVSWMQTVSKYNTKSRLISQVDYNLSKSKMVWKKHFSYNENNQVISMTQKNGSAVSECPDNDTYSEDYIYDSKKLLEKIIHKFSNVICEMDVKYE